MALTHAGLHLGLAALSDLVAETWLGFMHISKCGDNLTPQHTQLLSSDNHELRYNVDAVYVWYRGLGQNSERQWFQSLSQVRYNGKAKPPSSLHDW